ncbi:hypothetical protein ACLB1E_20505 [Escherichia coli]
MSASTIGAGRFPTLTTEAVASAAAAATVFSPPRLYGNCYYRLPILP